MFQITSFYNASKACALISHSFHIGEVYLNMYTIAGLLKVRESVCFHI